VSLQKDGDEKHCLYDMPLPSETVPRCRAPPDFMG
jgi:hypothetical protein